MLQRLIDRMVAAKVPPSIPWGSRAWAAPTSPPSSARAERWRASRLTSSRPRAMCGRDSSSARSPGRRLGPPSSRRDGERSSRSAASPATRRLSDVWPRSMGWRCLSCGLCVARRAARAASHGPALGRLRRTPPCSRSRARPLRRALRARWRRCRPFPPTLRRPLAHVALASAPWHTSWPSGAFGAWAQRSWHVSAQR